MHFAENNAVAVVKINFVRHHTRQLDTEFIRGRKNTSLRSNPRARLRIINSPPSEAVRVGMCRILSIRG